MPMYEYQCDECGPFTEILSLQNYTPRCLCPNCGEQAKRVISAPNFPTLPRATRIAHERNERAAHEPKHARKETTKRGHQCTASCNHKKGLQKGNNRPWMLGH